MSPFQRAVRERPSPGAHARDKFKRQEFSALPESGALLLLLPATRRGAAALDHAPPLVRTHPAPALAQCVALLRRHLAHAIVGLLQLRLLLGRHLLVTIEGGANLLTLVGRQAAPGLETLLRGGALVRDSSVPIAANRWRDAPADRRAARPSVGERLQQRLLVLAQRVPGSAVRARDTACAGRGPDADRAESRSRPGALLHETTSFGSSITTGSSDRIPMRRVLVLVEKLNPILFLTVPAAEVLEKVEELGRCTFLSLLSASAPGPRRQRRDSSSGHRHQLDAVLLRSASTHS